MDPRYPPSCPQHIIASKSESLLGSTLLKYFATYTFISSSSEKISGADTKNEIFLLGPAALYSLRPIMCGDSHLPPAPSLGDAVALILPLTRGEAYSKPGDSWRLQLSNRSQADEDDTRLTYELRPDWWHGSMVLRIQYVYSVADNYPTFASMSFDVSESKIRPFEQS